MTLMNRTNNHGSKRNIYSRGSSYSSSSSSYSSNVPANSYSSAGIPQAFLDDETGHNAGMRRNSAAPRSKGGKSWIFTLGVFVAFVLVTGYSLISHRERKMMTAQLAEQEATMRELEIDLSMKFDTKVKNLNTENTSLKRKLSDAKEKNIQNQNLSDEKKLLDRTLKNAKVEIRDMMHKNERLSKSRTTIQQNIQRMSKEAVLAKFGPGPHRLELYLRFDSHLGHTDSGTITIELAPLDELPHAVHWFLEQVDRKLYDGWSFHRNVRHVIMAGATRNFLTEKKPPNTKDFRDAGFHSLLFQEYSQNFPHRKNTLGFAGRPGGPLFYINKSDNSKIHGPGGQRNQDDTSEADTCFAKVVDGFDVVDRMHNLPTKEGEALKNNVAIVSIRQQKKK